MKCTLLDSVRLGVRENGEYGRNGEGNRTRMFEIRSKQRRKRGEKSESGSEKQRPLSL